MLQTRGNVIGRRIYTLLKDRKILGLLRRGWKPKQIHFTLGYTMNEIYKAMARAGIDRRQEQLPTSETRRKTDLNGRIWAK